MRFVKWLAGLLCIGLLCVLLSASGENYVLLSTGWTRTDVTDIRAVLEPDELYLLDRFPHLKSLDMSGSTHYEELIAWEQAHPGIRLRYTVELPDGAVLENTAEELDLSQLPTELAEETLPMLDWLPQLQRVDLGDLSRGLTPEQALAYRAAYPEIAFTYRFKLFGQSLSDASTTLDLSRRGHGDVRELIRYLPLMDQLKTIDLGSDETEGRFDWADIAAIEAAYPEAEYQYDFTLFDKPFSLTDTTMDLSHIHMYDGGAAVREVIACMPRLTYLDMDSCRVSNEDMAAIRDAFPQVKVVWRVWFGDNYSVRTDVERILASKPTMGGNVDNGDVDDLKYCTDVKYLDLGHNEYVGDISFVSYMPNLEVAVLAMNCWSDASPLADCPHLEYLEIQTTNLSDLTPLSGLKELKHLNICYLFNLTDISPLYELTQLERLWIGCLSPVPEEQVAHMQEIAPDCVINTTTYDPTEGGWRFDSTTESGLAPRYELLREQFGGYSILQYSFIWNDPLS